MSGEGDVDVYGASLASLRGALRGDVICPEDERYDQARTVHNASIDRRPAVIARCLEAADVRTALMFAQEHALEVAVRGGGHSPSGHCVVDGGLVIDLSGMRSVKVDPETRVARVAGGALLGDLDRATHPFGMATPTGIIS
ncbi:MAG: FAD-dependent oxidoreductase, partial [Actinomycetota bacterium]